MSSIGTRLPRKEDPRLLRGRGRFGDDISVPAWSSVLSAKFKLPAAMLTASLRAWTVEIRAVCVTIDA